MWQSNQIQVFPDCAQMSLPPYDRASPYDRSGLTQHEVLGKLGVGNNGLHYRHHDINGER